MKPVVTGSVVKQLEVLDVDLQRIARDDRFRVLRLVALTISQPCIISHFFHYNYDYSST